MVSEFGLDLSGLVLDMTNFATYIDSTNDRAPIAQRGKAKQKPHRSAPGRPGEESFFGRHRYFTGGDDRSISHRETPETPFAR
jgi:hypothetical protein